MYYFKEINIKSSTQVNFAHQLYKELSILQHKKQNKPYFYYVEFILQ